jgi:hypothetical protein
MKEHIGPSLWHGREINSCTRCKYLRCQLVKSGRNPDYEYYCMHPTVLSGEHAKGRWDPLLSEIKARLPERLKYFTAQIAEEKAMIGKYGEFISNDSVTPETPDWCPVLHPCSQKPGAIPSAESKAQLP